MTGRLFDHHLRGCDKGTQSKQSDQSCLLEVGGLHLGTDSDCDLDANGYADAELRQGRLRRSELRPRACPPLTFTPAPTKGLT